MGGKIYLVCKVDKKRTRVSAKQLNFMLEHAYGVPLSKVYDIIIEGYRKDLRELIAKANANGSEITIVV